MPIGSVGEVKALSGTVTELYGIFLENTKKLGNSTLKVLHTSIYMAT